MPFSNMGNFGHYFFKYFSSTVLFLFSFFNEMNVCSVDIVPQVLEALFIFSVYFFSLFSDLVISTDLFSSAVFISFVFFNLL